MFNQKEYIKAYYQKNKNKWKRNYKYIPNGVREENKIRNEKIKEMYANGIIMKNIGIEFGITRQCVSLILKK